MLSCKIRTPCFLAFVLVLCSSIGEISTQSIDEIISSAAKSSDQFSSIQDRDDSVIRTELDILYTREQWNEMIRLDNTIGRQKRKAIRHTKYRWTNNVIPYQISDDFSARDREKITASLNDWNSYTCLIFRPARHGDRNQIRMQDEDGCYSYIGMQGGIQIVSLAPGCRIKRIIIHELGHAIGFYHEQTRPDRDNYVSILLENIEYNMDYNFKKYSTENGTSYGVPYDYTSVMHYGRYAFSYNGRITIQTKDDRYQKIIGEAPGLSFKDIKLANIMYNCAGRCGSKTCPSPGYLDKKCVCMCPGPSPKQPIRKCSEPCLDSNEQCADWAAIGECKKNPEWMPFNCKKSCNTCSSCLDSNEQCADWAAIGECKRNPEWMSSNCKKSCNTCSSCLDSNEQCADWAAIGECKRNPEWMSSNCKKSCNTCSSSGSGSVNSEASNDIPLEMDLLCIDIHNRCPSWKTKEYCVSPLFKAFMTKNCPKSCGICE